MTTYRLGRKQSPGGPYRSRQLWLIIVLIAVLVFGGNFLNQKLGGVAISFSRPFWSLRDLSSAAWQSFSSSLASKERLASENQTLRSKLALAQAGLKERDLLLQDNAWLRATLGRRPSSSVRQIARILVGWPTGPFDIFAVDIGRDNGSPAPAVGANVLTDGNIWLGQVAEVYRRTSKVKLLSLGGEMTPVVLGPERLPVILTGRGGGNFITTLPRGVEVNVGDVALTSGLDRDWIVAVVGSVQFDNVGAGQKVFLRQPLRAASLKYVELASD